ncbi:cyclic nucleotide-binding domain protein [Sphingobacterium spiritivorum ATCC 33300]|uniref:Cyclic nucleotide-binding domain protein n=1 Tax=Sphingobacterium spiritivorum ATCC 33300 TaxID=525372 RepID=C2FUB3_SPHSI|nr:Crp/Fnr family transcriptional regulator [Sphingobacterium spiritivorum]EEI93491.1 cyclic nucleotide-binding domain protein [Sphingobacterium spiritivorum ATCC 33300]QQS95833.1 Crp/Fnr family transcriptional regulator [Sphingobacterium spiritivorum]
MEKLAYMINGTKGKIRRELSRMLNNYGVKSLLSKQMFYEKCKIKTLAKGSNIFLEGQVNNSEYILLSGILHKYNSCEKENVVTTGFYVSKSLITPHFLRTRDNKSIFSLHAVTDVVLAEISSKEYKRLQKLFKEFEVFEKHYIQEEILQISHHKVFLRCYDAKERLLFFRRQFPDLEASIPHSLIASYLGITHVSLSRIRGEIAKSKITVEESANS